jgi:hypothetical protein
MWPFAVIVGDEVGHGLSEVALPERHDPIETLFLDRAHEPFGVRIRIRCAIRRVDDVHPRVGEEFPYGTTPRRIPVADEDAVSQKAPSSAKTN